MNTEHTLLSIDYYAQILKEKIWKGGPVYFDYPFVSQFTTPCCEDKRLAIPNPPPTDHEMKLAEKCYHLDTGDTRTLDDFIDLILSVAKKEGYVTSYEYLWDIDPADTKYLNSSYHWRTFRQIFKLYPDLLRISKEWGNVKLSREVTKKYFLNKNYLLLGVGFWNITISRKAFKWAAYVWDGAFMYEDLEWKWWWEYVFGKNKWKGDQRVNISESHTYVDRMRVLFTLLDKADAKTIAIDLELANHYKDQERSKIMNNFDNNYPHIDEDWIRWIVKNQLQVTRKILHDQLWGVPSRIFTADKTRVYFAEQVQIFKNWTLETFRNWL